MAELVVAAKKESRLCLCAFWQTEQQPQMPTGLKCRSAGIRLRKTKPLGLPKLREEKVPVRSRLIRMSWLLRHLFGQP